MTLRKLDLLYTEHLKEHGQYKEPANLDNIFPEG